jgi:hypothetical protein
MGDLLSASPYSFLFKQRLRNNAKVVIDTYINGKELFHSNGGITQAIFRLKIEHVED